MKKVIEPFRHDGKELARQVGKQIRTIRCQQNISVEALALQCDLNPAYLGCVERGLQNPSLFTLERISSGLKVNIQDLFQEPDVSFHSASSAFLHIKSAMQTLSPEQAKKLVQIIDAILEMHQ